MRWILFFYNFHSTFSHKEVRFNKKEILLEFHSLHWEGSGAPKLYPLLEIIEKLKIDKLKVTEGGNGVGEVFLADFRLEQAKPNKKRAASDKNVS